jgi:hypothetical protein
MHFFLRYVTYKCIMATPEGPVPTSIRRLLRKIPEGSAVEMSIY